MGKELGDSDVLTVLEFKRIYEWKYRAQKS